MLNRTHKGGGSMILPLRILLCLSPLTCSRQAGLFLLSIILMPSLWCKKTYKKAAGIIPLPIFLGSAAQLALPLVNVDFRFLREAPKLGIGDDDNEVNIFPIGGCIFFTTTFIYQF